MFVANSVFVFLFLFWIEGAGEIGTVRGLDEMGDRGGSAERARAWWRGVRREETTPNSALPLICSDESIATQQQPTRINEQK